MGSSKNTEPIQLARTSLCLAECGVGKHPTWCPTLRLELGLRGLSEWDPKTTDENDAKAQVMLSLGVLTGFLLKEGARK